MAHEITLLDKKHELAQTLLEEIHKELGIEGFTSDWYKDRCKQSHIIFSWMEMKASIFIDLSVVGITKLLIYNRLREACQSIVDLGQHTLTKLRQLSTEENQKMLRLREGLKNDRD